ncbi:MAG: hypothetical protein H6873_05630 [Hyphomicrobiaceae bacterium]|nr:hypothetical protein [Hyphomicrobiaceae bacterium]
MSIESAADRAAFISTDDFAETISWTPEGGSATDVAGILDLGERVADPFGGGSVQVAEARLICREADLPSGAAQGDAATIRSGSYLVREILPDGTGIAEVRFEKVVS